MDTPGTPPEDFPPEDSDVPSQDVGGSQETPEQPEDSSRQASESSAPSDEPLLPSIDESPAVHASSAAEIARQGELGHAAPQEDTWEDDSVEPVEDVVASSGDDDEPTGADVEPAEPYRPPFVAPSPAPFVAPRPPQLSVSARRANRRRLRYTLYVRRTSRARAAAKSATLTRAAWATIVALLVLTLGTIATSVSAAAAYYSTEQVSIAALSRTVSSRDSLRIYDSKGVLLYQRNNFGSQHSIPLSNMPINVVNATIAIEDHTFWTNPGVDVTSIARAAQANFSSGSISQGASTITQQLVKLNILGGNETYTRKLKEAILAVGLTETGTYSKQQILQMYLNSIGYGHEAYGIDSAAQIYFGYQDDPHTGMSAAQHLDLAQASILAGVPQNPNTNDPIAHFVQAQQRQREVLSDMVKYGYITQADARTALAETSQPGFFANFHYGMRSLAPAFTDFVLDQITSMVVAGQVSLSRSGLNVYTTLDLDLQNYAQAAMQKHLYGTDHDDFGGGGLIRNDHVTNTAGIMVQQSTGAIKIMLGSVDYYSAKINGEFNVATQGQRSAGSSFKPIVYTTAFEKGWFPAMTIADTPTVFWDAGADKPWKPLDFFIGTPHFSGELTLRDALQNSLNIPAVKVMQYAGIQDVKRNATRMGLRDYLGTWGLSSVLGTLDVTPYDMAQMYTVLANYGQYIPLHSIDRITDSLGNTLYTYQQPRPVQVLTPQATYMTTSVLEDNGARTEFGLCSPLFLDPLTSPDLPGYITSSRQGAIGSKECGAIYAAHGKSKNAWPAAVKTGTAQDFTDDWTVGYTMDYTMAVWAGNNDHTPMHRIDGITGAAPTWYRSMLYAEQRDNLPKRDFPAPSGLQLATWTSNNITSTDWFLTGALPPNNIGSTGTNFTPCFTQDDTNPWNFCSAPTTPSGGGSQGGGGGGGAPSPIPIPGGPPPKHGG